jgi:hypothetical protein
VIALTTQAMKRVGRFFFEVLTELKAELEISRARRLLESLPPSPRATSARARNDSG